MKQFQKIQLLQDGNDYWYAVPIEKINEFKVDDACHRELNLKEWVRKYSQYMLGRTIYNGWLDLYIEKKDIDTIDC